MTFNPDSNPSDFGPITLPQSDETAERLRNALAQVADRKPAETPPAVAHLALEPAPDLERILGAALDRRTAYPDVSAQAEWSVYGSNTERGAAHLYRLQVTYDTKIQTHGPHRYAWCGPEAGQH